MKRLLGGIGGLVVLLAAAGLVAAKWWPGRSVDDRRPALAEVPPLPPVTRSSVVVTPVVIALSGIQDALEKAAPRDLSGKPNLPSLPNASGPEIGWSLSRGTFVLASRPEGLSLSTSLRGSLRATGQVASQQGQQGQQGQQDQQGGALFGPMPGGLPGVILLPDLIPPALRPPGFSSQPPGGGAQGQGQAKAFDQRADIDGSVTLTARPTLLAGWRIEPNLTSQVTIGDASLNVLGLKLNLSNEMKPTLERTIREQITTLQERIAGDSSLEQAARDGWARICRSISLGAAAPGMPNLWLELRPTRALAAQPRIDDAAVTVTIGVQAETRIVPVETKPSCPFPPQLEFVPQMEQGRVSIDLPIDIPFSELARLIQAQLVGKTFPEDKGAPLTATVRKVDVAASGDRLLMSIGITATEGKSWFGLSADATIHVWGRPVLDTARRTLRFRDVALDVDSAAAFGALSAAARAAVPYLERSLADNAVIDLAALAAEARRNIEHALADFRKSADGVRVDAAVIDLRLTDIAFDAKTLRVIGEADGTVRVAVSKLPEK
jgi:hypothetical protein